MANVREIIRTFLLDTFLPGELSEMLTDSTHLQDQGILDSMGTLQLVSFLEQRFSVDFLPEELGSDQLSSLEKIEQLVTGKMESRA
jgi:acyl carrier protein